jgi:hypothetical protein
MFKDPSSESVSPAVTPDDLLSAVAGFLSPRTSRRNRLETRKDGGTPTPVRILWRNWHAFHEQRLQVARHKKNLQPKLFAEAGALPFLELAGSGDSGPAFLRSSADLKRYKGKLNRAERASLRAVLQHRRHLWDQAGARLGFSSAGALEHHLAEREALLRRVLWIRRPVTLTEVAAKLHCLLVTEDPDARLKYKPWPELRTILDDLVFVAAAQEEDARRTSKADR